MDAVEKIKLDEIARKTGPYSIDDCRTSCAAYWRRPVADFNRILQRDRNHPIEEAIARAGSDD